MWEKIDINIVVSISAAIIALSALFVSIWQGVLSRKHSRLSVRPRLRIDRNIYLRAPIEIVLSNYGIGPAILLKFGVYLDGEKIDKGDIPPVAEALKRLDIHGQVDTYTPSEGDIIGIDEKIALLCIREFPDNIENLGKLKKSLKRIGFQIQYMSMYREKFCESNAIK